MVVDEELTWHYFNSFLVGKEIAVYHQPQFVGEGVQGDLPMAILYFVDFRDAYFWSTAVIWMY